MRMLRVLLVFAVLLMTFSTFSQTPAIEPGVSQTLARWRKSNYSDVTYKLDITLEKGAPLMKGTIVVGVTLTAEGAANDLVLDWRTTPFANDKDKPYAILDGVNGDEKGDKLYAAETRDEHFVISKSLLLAGRNEFTIKFASPIKSSGAAVTRYLDKEDGGEYVYTLFVPSDASMAFPVFDQPDLKAKFDLSLTTPESWNVVANDVQITETTDKANGTTTHDFYVTQPISTYVFAFAAGDFSVFRSDLPPATTNTPSFSPDDRFCGGMKCSRIFVRRSQAEKFKQHEKEVFRLNREGVKFLEEYFDYRFPFSKYDLVLIPEFPFGGMEHAGATFLREASVIFPSEPTKNDYISRANVIFHEAAHQWFGDTVTMKWFDDLWLKEGFAEFMAYKTLEKVMPEYNAWKVFYERNKQAAYLTDSTKGTTPIYQEIANLSAAKSAYGNIVYRKAPSFLKQAEFYLGPDKFQTAVRSFLKNHQFANAEWKDLIEKFETASRLELKEWGEFWVKEPGLPKIRLRRNEDARGVNFGFCADQYDSFGLSRSWNLNFKVLEVYTNGDRVVEDASFATLFGKLKKKSTPISASWATEEICLQRSHENRKTAFIFPNFQDYGYGIFLLDDKSREYVLKNIGTEKDDFLRSMMWGSLWDSVREGELDPRAYVELAIKNIALEQDESTIQSILGRVGTAMNSYINTKIDDNLLSTAVVSGKRPFVIRRDPKTPKPSAKSPDAVLMERLERTLELRIASAKTQGQRITYYRAYLGLASSRSANIILKAILAGKSSLAVFQLRTKDKFDIVTRLLINGDPDAPKLLADLEKSETSDDAKRYAYAARAGVADAQAKARYFDDFLNNKTISESWIEAAFGPFNSPKHSALTLQYLEKALAELPNLKKNRKIFFVNGWLGAFIGGQKSPEALAIVNKFLADTPNLDRDLKLKILEVSDGLERAVRIREKFGAKK